MSDVRPIHSVNDVLIDLLDDNRRRLGRLFGRIDDDCLHWSPDPETNSIALTVWHMGRIYDLFVTQQIMGREAADERWFQGGWAEKTGYDPGGIGRDGWGTLNDYTPDEVAAIPRMERDLLLDYLDEVYDRVRYYLRETSNETLQEPAPGFEGRFTRYQCVQMALMDNVRHMGEIYALRARWTRELGERQAASE
jgi:hypothetical protein